MSGEKKKNDVVLPIVLILLFGQIQRLYSPLVHISSGNLDYLLKFVLVYHIYLLNMQSSFFSPCDLFILFVQRLLKFWKKCTAR
jgi:hypothetical protein